MAELNSAYWVAVKETAVRLDSQATKAATASPALRLSAAITRVNARMSAAAPASQAKAILVAAARMAPVNSMRIMPTFRARKPPIKLPAMVINSPNILVTPAISVLLKPKSW